MLIPLALGAALLAGFFEASWLGKTTALWTERIEPIVGITTLIIALSVWRGEVRQDWQNNLPKKLTVIFNYRGKAIMKCLLADLASEADIRPLGQQIGSQMAGTRDLQFIAPLVKQVEGKVSLTEEQGFFRDYQVTFELTALPTGGKLAGLNKEEYLLWTPPFANGPEKAFHHP